jgi:hypothetical protein
MKPLASVLFGLLVASCTKVEGGACVHPQVMLGQVMECDESVTLEVCGTGGSHQFHLGKRCAEVGYTVRYGGTQWTRPEYGSCMVGDECMPNLEKVSCFGREGRFSAGGSCPSPDDP